MKHLSIFIFLALLLFSCERPYEQITVFEQPQIVVEGYVEYGPTALPVYLFLTRSYDYRGSSLSAEEFNKLFVRNAQVLVSDGGNEVELTEICLEDLESLDPALRSGFVSSLGLNEGMLGDLNFCVYIDIADFLGNSVLQKELGRSYSLSIRTAEGQELRSSTTITRPVGLDTLFYGDHPDFPRNDSLIKVFASFQDPPNERNYYRLLTRRNQEPFYRASSFAVGSVTDDAIFDGQSFGFPIERGQGPTEEFDPSTFGFFKRGDTITVRAGTVDFEHFRFWQTLDYSISTQGPFGTYVRIQSNIEGGLGVWGAFSLNDYTIIVPE